MIFDVFEISRRTAESNGTLPSVLCFQKDRFRGQMHVPDEGGSRYIA